MRFLPARRQSTEVAEVDRSAAEYTLDEWIAYVNEFVYNGNGYITQGVNQTMPGQKQEPIGPAYRTLTDLAYKSDSVVFACMQTRARHFRQVSFKFRNLSTKKLHGNEELRPLEEPWAGGTTADLLTRMILHADLGGNAFVVRRGDGLALLRPDWVTIVVGSDTDPEMGAWATDAAVLGYVYSPGGYGTDGNEREVFGPEEVAHFAPIPDPEARFRGMSWLTPLIREVMGDKAATEHKLRYFENPTPNLYVKMDVPNLDEFKEQVKAFKEAHMGARNAYKWMFGAAGVDVTPVGTNMKDLDYKQITGAGETRIAAAAGTPPVLVGLSEGLQGSSLNSGNYQAARRQFVDGVIRDLWQDAAGSLANIITVQSGSQLWYDDGDVAFVKEDLKERAEVMAQKAQTARYLVDAGYKPDSVIQAIESEDFSVLEHSGLFSVQLQAANAPKQGLFTGAVTPNDASSPQGEAAGNGNGPSPTPATNGNGRSALDPELLEALSRPETHIHFDEGSFVIPQPAPPDVHIHEGAVRSEVHVDSPTTRFEEGSIQAHPAEVTFEEGAIHNEVTTPDVHVDAPVTIEEGAVRVEPASVTVEPTRIEEGAVKVEVTAPDITVEPARLEMPEGAVQVTVEPADVTVEAAPAPDVHIHQPDQRPRKATATRNEDGSLEVTYGEDE